MKLFAIVMVVLAAVLSVALSYLFAGVKDISTTAWGSSDAKAALVRTFINVLIATIGYGIFGINFFINVAFGSNVLNLLNKCVVNIS